MPPARILFAVTSHGLGHLTRSLAIARAFRDLHAEVELIVATTVSRDRVALDLPPPFELHRVAYEPGTLQHTCFELDVPGTRRAYAAELAGRDARLAAERDFLRAISCDGVVSDIPALPVRAAADLGLPVVGVANFTWDWILAALLGEGDPTVVRLAEEYAAGGLHLRLPFGPPTSPFARSEPAPLVSRHARLEAAEVRRRLGIGVERTQRLVLVCPGGWEADRWQPIRVRDCEGFQFVAVGDLPISADVPVLSLPHALPEGIGFPDLVAAADVVLAKPGYGIASECVSHGTPLVAIERPLFPETPVLLEDFRRLGPLATLSLEDFFAGRWQAALDAVSAGSTSFESVPSDGASRVARRVGEFLGLAVLAEPSHGACG